MKKIIAAILVIVGCSFLIYDGVINKTTEADFFSMATFAKVKINGFKSGKCAEEIQDSAEYFETQIISRHSDSSEISAVNRNGSINASGKLAEYLAVLEDVAEKSGGKYNYALGEISDLWGFSGAGGRVPDEEELSKAVNRAKASYSNGVLTVEAGASVDLASAGKGMALDEAKKCLEKYNIRSAIVSFGGSVLLYGNKDFKVGIRYPEALNSSQIAIIKTRNCCISTSGSYLQEFEQDGKSYHHIFDPETGYPVQNGIKSVTIISENGTLSDALSTACFVLGIKDGMELAEKYGCGIVIVNDKKEVFMNDRAAAVTEMTDPEFKTADAYET